jgi:hypothetical protein
MANTPYLYLTAPLSFNETPSGDVDVYTAYTDILGQPSRALWVLDQLGTNSWTGGISSGGGNDSSDVIPILVPNGYAITGYSLTLSNIAVNSSAIFDFGSSSGGTFDDYRPLTSFTGSGLAGAGSYNITIGSGVNVLDYTFQVTVIKVNEAPTVTETASDPTFYAGGTAVGLFSNVAITNDQLGPNITKFSLTVDGVVAADNEFLSLNGTDIHLVGGQSNSLGGSITYTTVDNGGGSIQINLTMGAGVAPSTLEALLDGMTYKNTSAAPTLGDRYVSFTSISDDGGTANGGVDTGDLWDYTTITVAAAPNDPPALAIVGGNTAFVESAGPTSTPVAIASSLTITDSDNSTLTKATVSITGNFHSGEDILAFTNTGAAMGNIAASYDATTGVLSLSSADGSATLAEWQTALEAVTYNNASNNPNTGDRTISFSVDDGTSPSNTATKVLTVAATNDAPVVTTSGAATNFVEGNNVASTPVAIDSALTLSDVDSSTLASATVTIGAGFAAGEDVLGFTNNPATMGNISGSYVAGTGTFTLTSTGSSATLAQWQAALRSVTYTDTSQTPDTTTRVVSFQVSDGTSSSTVSTKSVTVTSVNDSPIATASGGDTQFVESTSGTSTPVVIDSAIMLSDSDSATLASANVSITGNFKAGEDVLGFNNDGASMGNITATYNATNGQLSLTSAGNSATVTQWQTALHAITYTNTSSDPDNSPRTIAFVVNDNNSNSTATTKTVLITAANNVPVVTASTHAGEFEEGISGPVAVDSGIVVNDLDNATLASAVVSIVGNPHADQDVLAFNGSAATGNIVGGYDATTGELTLTSSGASATLAQWQAALQSVTYDNTSQDPTGGARTISFVVNDASDSSVAVTQNVSVLPVNDAPVLSSSATPATFTEDAAAVVVNNSVIIADVDNTTFYSAKVKITDFQAGQDKLALPSGTSGIGDIIATFNSTTGELSLSSASHATLAQWQTALSAVTYANTSQAPTGTSRNIEFTLNDGEFNSNVLTQTLDVVAVNDAPHITLAAPTQSVRQDTTLTFSAANHNLISISDVDAGDDTVQVTLSSNHGTLTLGSDTGLVVSDILGTLVISGTLSAINAGLNGLKFVPTTGYTGTASINLLVNDQNASDPLTDAQSVGVTITATPTTPTTPTNPTNPPVTVDGAAVSTNPVTLPNGETGTSIAVGLVTDTRQDSTGDASKADIDLVGSGTSASLSVKLPVGYGLTSTGGAAKTAGDSAETLKAAIDAVTASTDQAHQNVNGQNFLDKLADATGLLVNTITPITSSTAPTQPLELTGSSGSQLTALVIDAGQMNGTGSLVLNNVDFAAVIGQTTVRGDTAGQVLTGDDASQSFVVNAGDSFVFAGGGNDTLQITSFAAANNSVLQGGQGNDTVKFTGASSQYGIEQHGGFTIVTNKDDPSQQVKVVNVENLTFADGAVTIPTDTLQTTLASLYQSVLGRQADVGGFDYWTQQSISIGGIGLSILNSTEAGAKALNGDVSHDIGALYSAFFGRAVDTEGQAYWTEQVQQGHLTFVQVADSLLTSAEMANYNKAPATWDFTV